MLQVYDNLDQFVRQCGTIDTYVDHKTTDIMFYVKDDDGVEIYEEVWIEGNKWEVYDSWKVGFNGLTGVFLVRKPYLFSRQIGYMIDELIEKIYGENPGKVAQDCEGEPIVKFGPELTAYYQGMNDAVNMSTRIIMNYFDEED